MDFGNCRCICVVGAGPAGIFAAKELVNNNHKVVLLNRDIKPGGLAEYGIYPSKTKLKDGLRKQFISILNHENLHYIGNLAIGKRADYTLDDLRTMGFDAILVSIGAQGTKWLGVPGEELTGCYHAKDIVYHYNLLPPYSSREFDFGKKVAIIGVGNVMMDIARYLITEKKVEAVTALARRGPAEVKFSRKELEYVIKNLDMDDFHHEMEKVSDEMIALGQDPNESLQFFDQAYANADETNSNTVLKIKFLSSPKAIYGDDKNKVENLEIEYNKLYAQQGVTKARGTGIRSIMDVDSVIYAIGDSIDPNLGLPYDRNEYVINPHPRFPINDISYECFDPAQQQVIEDVFLAGWSRKTSDGQVGNARKDGVSAVQAIEMYLKTLETPPKANLDKIISNFLGEKKFVNKHDLNVLMAEENKVAAENNLEFYKFGSNPEMLAIINKFRQQEKPGTTV